MLFYTGNCNFSNSILCARLCN